MRRRTETRSPSTPPKIDAMADSDYTGRNPSPARALERIEERTGWVRGTRRNEVRNMRTTMNHVQTTKSNPARRCLLTLALATALGASSSAFAGVPDLGPTSVVGPGTSYTSAPTIVTVNVANFGDPLIGNYTLEIVLSTDSVVDGSDLVVGSLSTSTLGYVGVPLTVPANAPTGLLYWGARISGASGELALANNAAIGTQGYVQALDLSLDDASPIQFFVRPSDVTSLQAEVVVNNLGTPDSVLVFSVDPQQPAPWLEIAPPSSFAVAGQTGQPIDLIAHYEGLVPGSYSTTLRFQNFFNTSDFVDLPVTLTVGDPKFVPGDRLLGQVASIGDKDDMKFDGIKGMLLKIKFGVKAGDLAPQVQVIDPNGQVETTLNFSNKQKLKKVAKLKTSGEYTLRVLSKDGTTTGGWFAKTDRKLPKAGEARVVNVKSPGAGFASVEVRLLPGAKLDFAVRINNVFAGPTQLGFMSPLGSQLDILSNIQPANGKETRVEDVLTEKCGSYFIEVAGFGADPKAKAKVGVLPVQPKRGKAKVYVP